MVNKVILVGNVGLDPEVRSLEGGVKTARVRLATTERFYNRETQQSREHTEWHTIIFWRGLAEVVDKYVRKGSQIYIEGRLRSREWEDQNGVKRFSIEVVADDLKLLGRKPEGAPAGNYASTPAAPTATSGPTPAATPPQQPSIPETPYAPPAAEPIAPAPEIGSDPDDLPF